jgi:hypothetical protein
MKWLALLRSAEEGKGSKRSLGAGDMENKLCFKHRAAVYKKSLQAFLSVEA